MPKINVWHIFEIDFINVIKRVYGNNLILCNRIRTLAPTHKAQHLLTCQCDYSAHSPAAPPAGSSPAPPAGRTRYCPVVLSDSPSVLRPPGPPAPPMSLTDSTRGQLERGRLAVNHQTPNDQLDTVSNTGTIKSQKL